MERNPSVIRMEGKQKVCRQAHSIGFQVYLLQGFYCDSLNLYCHVFVLWRHKSDKFAVAEKASEQVLL